MDLSSGNSNGHTMWSCLPTIKLEVILSKKQHEPKIKDDNARPGGGTKVNIRFDHNIKPLPHPFFVHG